MQWCNLQFTQQVRWPWAATVPSCAHTPLTCQALCCLPVAMITGVHSRLSGSDKQTNSSSGSRSEQGRHPPTHTTPLALLLLQVFEQEMQLGPAAALENLQQLLVSRIVRPKRLYTHHTTKQSPQPFACNQSERTVPLTVQPTRTGQQRQLNKMAVVACVNT